jgi:uncharacterized membrane protein (TIGR02234 family)
MRDRSFGPTVLAGLAGSALLTVAAGRDWASATGDAAGVPITAAAKGSEAAPLVVALGLVALASWGVVLVVRGRLRRTVAGIGVLACIGALAATGLGSDAAQVDAVKALQGKGTTGSTAAASLTGWYYAALVGALLATAAFVVAVVTSPRWPAMGTRYDAPGARAAQPRTEQDLWRAMDEGHDPTA